MFKWLLKGLITVLFLGSMTMALAGGPDTAAPNPNRIGFGINYHSDFLNSVGPFFMYQTPGFDFKVGTLLVTNREVTAFGLSGEFGFDKPLVQKLDLSYGVSGFVIFRNNDLDNMWGIGPDVGLNYYATHHVMIFANTEPFSYERNEVGVNTYSFFKSGRVGIVYLF